MLQAWELSQFGQISDLPASAVIPPPQIFINKNMCTSETVRFSNGLSDSTDLFSNGLSWYFTKCTSGKRGGQFIEEQLIKISREGR